MPHRKVVHPSPKNRVDQFDHPPHRLTGKPSEHIPELPQQRRPLLQLRRIVGPPCSLTTENATKFKTQESKTVPLCEVGQSAFLLVDLDSQFGQLLPQSLVHRLHQPVMPRMSSRLISPDHPQNVHIGRRCIFRCAWLLSLGAIGCLLRPSRKSFAAALVLYALAIAASGNGFLLLPLGLLVCGLPAAVRAAGWLAVSAVCIAAYAYRYNPMSSQSPSHGSVFSALLHLRPDYAIAFAGNAGAIAGKSALSIGISLALGASLLALFGWLARRGYGRRNPFVSCSVLFVLLTALGVAGLRSESD